MLSNELLPVTADNRGLVITGSIQGFPFLITKGKVKTSDELH